MQDEKEVVISTVQDASEVIQGSEQIEVSEDVVVSITEDTPSESPGDAGMVVSSKPIHPKEDQGYRWVEINPADRNFIVEALRNLPIKNVYTGRRIESMVQKVEGKKIRTNHETPV